MDAPEKSDLTKVQQQAWDAVVTRRKNVYVTGMAGTGKSYLIQSVVKEMRLRQHKRVAVTALTGCAADQISGVTLHSFVGVGLAKEPREKLARKVRRYRSVAERIRNCDLLVIDEVSMMSPDLFQKIDYVIRSVRAISSLPFGGLQVLLVADFCQLDAIRTGAEAKGEYGHTYVFEMPLWRKLVHETFVLDEVFRQRDDVFLQILAEARVGRLSALSCRLLHERMNAEIDLTDGIRPTILCTKNNEVRRINLSELNKIEGTAQEYKMTHRVVGRNKQAGRQKLERIIDRCMANQVLCLKKGAQVMLLRNLDVEAGLYNGARGVVVNFSQNANMPIVKFANDNIVTIQGSTWQVSSSDWDHEHPNGPGWCVMLSQIPLRLAWAMTIHKSQGSTIDKLVVSLARMFQPGQAYVALSRVRSLEGLSLRAFDPKCFYVNSKVVDHYASLKRRTAKEGEGVNDA